MVFDESESQGWCTECAYFLANSEPRGAYSAGAYKKKRVADAPFTGVGTPDGIWFFTAACRPSDTCLGLLMDQLHNFGPYTKTAHKKFLK